MFQESIDKFGNSSWKDILLFVLLIVVFFSVGGVVLYLEKVFGGTKAPRYIYIAIAFVAIYLIYRFRILGFRYTVFYKAPKPEFDPRFNDMMLHEDYPYPVGTVVFEKTASAKGKILAAVSRDRIKAFLKPGEKYAEPEKISDTMNLSCGKIEKAHSIVYEKDGKLCCIYFKPSQKFTEYIDCIMAPGFGTEPETETDTDTDTESGEKAGTGAETEI